MRNVLLTGVVVLMLARPERTEAQVLAPPEESRIRERAVDTVGLCRIDPWHKFAPCEKGQAVILGACWRRTKQAASDACPVVFDGVCFERVTVPRTVPGWVPTGGDKATSGSTRPG
jgi:hypothetical protein